MSHFIRHAEVAPDHVQHSCHQVADLLKCRRPYQVLASAQIASPCLTGVYRLTVLLPRHVCEPTGTIDLRAILAHELAHLRSRDLAWNLASQVCAILLWFLPLVWRMRAAHAGACEAVCDAVAADLINDLPAYNRTLARLALQVEAAPPAASLAMARVSTVRRRILALNKRFFRMPLRLRQVVPALCIGALLCASIGSMGFTLREPETSFIEILPPLANEEPQAQTSRKVTGQVLMNGLPVEGIKVSLWPRGGEVTDEKRRLLDDKFLHTTTAADGTFTFDTAAKGFLLFASCREGSGSISSR